MAKIPLVPISIELNGPIFNAIASWSFEDEFVCRILTEDIPQRMKYQDGRIWAYRDPENTVVGFGTLSVCNDYREFTGGKYHMYIPLLAVHPDKRGLGHGKTIVDHLVGEAACLVASVRAGIMHSAVFLDVYEDSAAAIGLYKSRGFQQLGGTAFVDPLNDKGFYVMAKRVSG
jgi:ribosomal protein S18 acetylase RimI-like enzyme